MDIATRNKLMFLDKVRRSHPNLYRAALSNNGLAGLGDVVDTATGPVISVTPTASASPAADVATQAPWWQQTLNNVVSTIQQLAPTYIATKQAQQCVSVNADRARQGLSPIDCAGSNLAPQVAVGISPDIKTLGYLGIGVILFGILMFSRKR